MKEGGSYIKDKGKPVRLVARTKPHPDGDRPRDQHGRPLDVPQPASKPAANPKGKE